MNYWLLFIPFIAALLGWCLNWLLIFLFFHPVKPLKIFNRTFQGLIPKNQFYIADQVAKYAGSQISFSQIEEKITQPENIEKIMPFVETEIDHFLRIRLAEQMPMISAFIGEKTITQLKTIFTEELRVLFPQLISNYIHTIQPDIAIKAAIVQKITSIPPESIEMMLHRILKKELQLMRIMGAVTGFFIGLLQIIAILFLS